MLNRKFIIFTLLVLLMPLLTILLPLPVNAAPPAITITPVQSAVSTNVDYCFGWASSGLANTDTLFVLFPTNETDANIRFDVEALTASEVTFYVGTSTCSGGTSRATETGSTDDNGQDKVTIVNRATSWITAGMYVGIILDLDSLDGTTNPFIIADSTPISIGFANVAGDSVLTPATAGNYKVVLEQIVEGTNPTEVDWFDTQLLYIGDLNKVNITATLDPSISLALDTNTCNLGILAVDAIKACGYTATVTTNIGTGYTGYVEQNHPFQSIVNGVTTAITGPGNSVIEGDEDPNPLSGDYGEYGFGIQTDDTTSIPEFTGACGDYDDAVTDLPATSLAADNTRYAFASYTAATNGVDHGVTAFCNGVRIKYTTPPGQYDQTLTITIVGNF